MEKVDANKPLRALLVEDSEDDARLIVRAVKQGGYDIAWERVETAAAVVAALRRERWDIVIADYSLPGFSGLEALRLLKDSGRDAPFILVSGTIGEEVAVAALKAGANDYLMKGNLARLVPAIERELREAEARRERRQAEKRIESLARFPTENPHPVLRLAADGTILYANPGAQPLLQAWSRQVGQRLETSWTTRISEAASGSVQELEVECGSRLFSLVMSRANGAADLNVYGRDITERRRAEEALRKSRQDFLRVFLSSPTAVSINSAAEGRYVAVNEAWEKLSGYRREDAIGRTTRELKIWADEAEREKVLQLIRETGRVRDLEVRFQRCIGLFSLEPIEFAGEPCYISTIIDVTARKEAEVSLRLFRTLIDRSTDAIEVIDPQTARFIDVSESLCGQLGYTRGELLAMTVLDVTADTDRAEFDAMTATLRQTGSATVEKLQRRKDGSLMPAELSLSLVALDREYGVAIVRDITERKRNEAALLTSEARYRSLFANMTEGFAYCRMIYESGRPADLVYLEVNNAFSTLTGLHDVVGRNVSEVIPGLRESDPKILERCGRVALTGCPERFEIYCAALKMWFDISLYCPARGSFVAVFDVITRRKESENRIREQAELLNQANEAIVVVNLDDRITFWNRGAERVHGWTAAEMTGRNLFEALAQTGFGENKEMLAAAATLGDWRGESSGRNRKGEPLVMETSVTVLRDEAGRPTGRISISTDITEKKRLQEQFLRAQRLESLGMLAAGIAHDLNNILAPIGMSSSLLRQHVSGTGDLRLLDTLEKCADRGAGLVKQILGFARGIGGESRVVQVKHLLRDIADVITETFPKSIVLDENIPTELWTVQANPTQIHQVLLNLSVNARDAMPNGGTLRLRAENLRLDEDAARALEARQPGVGARAGVWLALHVEDTGTGIPPEILPRIWEPFFTTKTGAKGSGLGLSTVQGIVATHQGFVTLESAVGRGTTFRVHLPAVDVAIASAVRPIAPAVVQGHGELILVAEDEELIRKTAEAVLKRAGYRVVTAADGAAAAEAFAAHAGQFALVISDFDMPRLRGDELARLIRARNPSMKVLEMSGLDSQSMGRDRKRERFAETFLPKPFTAAALLNAVEDALHGNTPAN